jgi:ethanolamine utilization protein EutJ
MDFLEEANRRIDALRQAMLEPVIPVNGMPVYIGADIGTANVVTVAVDAEGNPLAGEIQPARVVREGLIVDYLSAVTIITKQV